ncbi:MAG: Na/Pi cotransporter family protein [Spirochaetaceae bacterium]|nr:MAG: Na/Pi cotransporter family protein [Spirochaetaceae bacterium]
MASILPLMPSDAGGMLMLLFSVVGSLAIFLLGMRSITEGLLRRYGQQFRRLVAGKPDCRWRSLLRGVMAGALSGTPVTGTVLLSSMVNIGSVPLRRTPVILLGINAGATLSGWLLAWFAYSLGLAQYGLVLLAFALPLLVQAKVEGRSRHDFLIGTGMVLLGMQLLNGSLSVGFPEEVWLQYLRLVSNQPAILPVLFLVGVGAAAIFRSSLGVLALAMALGFRGWLSLEMSAAMVIGGSLGIALTGLMVALRLGINARRAAFAHVLITLFGCLWLFLLFPLVIDIVDMALPGYRYQAEHIPVKLALLQSLLHAGNLLFLLPFSSLFTQISRKIFKADESENDTPETDEFRLALLPAGIPEALDSNLLHTQRGLGKMAALSYQMLMMVMNSSQLPETCESSAMALNETSLVLSGIRRQISQALVGASQQPCNRVQAETIQKQQRIAHELRQIGSDCQHIMEVLCRSYRKQYRFHEEAQEELFGFSAQILDFLQYNGDYLQEKIDSFDYSLAEKMEQGIHNARNILKKRSRKWMEKKPDAHIRGELAFIEIVGYLENIGDSCLHISSTVPQLQRMQEAE